MKRHVSLRTCALFCCVFGVAADMYSCKTPPFDKRRCYEICLNQLPWSTAWAVSKTRGQRLAILENEQLVKFVVDNLMFSSVWIGLSRTRDGQPDMWTSGQRLDAGLYRGVVLNVSRGSTDAGKLCSLIQKDRTPSFVNMDCSSGNVAMCETFPSNIFQIKPVGGVIADVSSGQLVASDIISVLDCVRKCREDWTCRAISHDDVKCKLHLQQLSHSITVTHDAAVYKRLNA